MYEQRFHFNSQPFTLTPFVKHYFAAQSINQGLSSARLCIDRGSGPVMVVGDVGTGKSLLLAMLEEQYRSQFSVVNLACARLDDRQELLQSILFELQIPYRGMSEGELRLSLMDYLKPSQACPNGMLLLVDEAHNLPIDLLDEVRLITNYVRDGQPRVRLVMAGNNRLEEKLGDPKLESFNQRVASRCYLNRLSQAETAEYVTTHVNRVGGDGARLFPTATLRAIHELTDGCPRTINQVCDHALVLGSTSAVKSISETMLREAWNDVQCLPGGSGSNPRTFGSPSTLASPLSKLKQDEKWTVIEFGNLDDEAVVENVPTTACSPKEMFAEDEVESLIAEPELTPATHVDFQSDSSAEVVEYESSHWQSPNESHEQDLTFETTSQQELPVPVSHHDGESNENSDAQTIIESHSFDDPFAEPFEFEEDVLERYMPLVAAQNQRSQEVTSSQLRGLRPLAESENYPQLSDNKHHVEAEICQSAVPHETTQHDQEPDHDSHTSTIGFEDHRYKPAAVSFVNDDVDDVNPAHVDDDVEVSQRMLREIIEEKNRLTARAFAQDDQWSQIDQPTPFLPARPVSVETPAEQIVDKATIEYSSGQGHFDQQDSFQRQDDRDLIVVSRKDEVPTPVREKEKPILFPATAVSTGQAKRMDYQQLFDQLRNISQD